MQRRVEGWDRMWDLEDSADGDELPCVPSEGSLALFPLRQFPLPTAGAGHQGWRGIGIPPWS